MGRGHSGDDIIDAARRRVLVPGTQRRFFGMLSLVLAEQLCIRLSIPDKGPKQRFDIRVSAERAILDVYKGHSRCT